MHYFELYKEFLADKRPQDVTPLTLKHYDDTVNYFFHDVARFDTSKPRRQIAFNTAKYLRVSA